MTSPAADAHPSPGRLRTTHEAGSSGSVRLGGPPIPALDLLPRAVGALTAAYGVYALADPGHLVSQGDLDPGASTDVLSRTIGVRDVASGASILAAPRGLALQVALGVRVLFDLADAVVFGTSLPTSDARLRVALIAAGWGAISAFAATRAGKRA